VLKHGTAEDQAYACVHLEQKYRHSLPDSSMYFITKAYNIAIENKLDSALIPIYGNLAITYKLLGDFDTTKYFFDLSMKLAEQLNDSSGLSSAYNNLGVLYDDMGDMDKALMYFVKSAELSELLDDLDGMALSNNNIGLIHYRLEEFDKARAYYEKALEQRIEMKDTGRIALLYNNIGILYYFENEPQKCLDFFKKALAIWESLGNKRETALVLSNVGELYYELQIYQSSMNYLEESRKLYKDLGDVHGELSVLTLLGQVYYEWGKPDKAIAFYKNAFSIAKELDAKTEMLDAAYNLSNVYQEQKKFKDANQFLNVYVELKDSVFNIEKSRSMQEVETKYETAKKEQEIVLLNKENELKEAALGQQKIINWALAIGAFLVLIVALLIVHENRIKKRNNQTLTLKNNEILQQNEEISAQRDEIEAQRDTVNRQKEEIEKIHQHVSESIHYAERIQSSTLPSPQLLVDNFKEHFVLFMPRDVVSGDFYWWSQVENQLVIAAADSTGHGVPGAFMSMLGMSLLKEIIIKEYVTHPGVILRKMRKEIIHTLKQKGDIGEQKDGMDMALISYNVETKMLQYSGANNPLCIVRKGPLSIDGEELKVQNIENSDYTLYEIKPDKMPISIHAKMDRFTTKEVQLQDGDLLYMFSDGYQDQFGGPRNKKFMYKPFKDLLIQLADNSLVDQKQMLQKTLKEWMYDKAQIDDILVMGIKV
jgi:serine phosphatase RsbU (regulator of sigma subunit)